MDIISITDKIELDVSQNGSHEGFVKNQIKKILKEKGYTCVTDDNKITTVTKVNGVKFSESTSPKMRAELPLAKKEFCNNIEDLLKKENISEEIKSILKLVKVHRCVVENISQNVAKELRSYSFLSIVRVDRTNYKIKDHSNLYIDMEEYKFFILKYNELFPQNRIVYNFYISSREYTTLIEKYNSVAEQPIIVCECMMYTKPTLRFDSGTKLLMHEHYSEQHLQIVDEEINLKKIKINELQELNKNERIEIFAQINLKKLKYDELQELHRSMEILETPEKSVKKNITCAICLEDINVPTCADCGHLCCFNCIEKWIILSHNCPVCRKEIRDVSRLRKIYM